MAACNLDHYGTSVPAIRSVANAAAAPYPGLATSGRALPRWFSALWHLPEGEFSYIEGRLDPASIAFSVPPAADMASPPRPPPERAG